VIHHKYRADISRFVVPECITENVIRAYDDDLVHCGLEKVRDSVNIIGFHSSVKVFMITLIIA